VTSKTNSTAENQTEEEGGSRSRFAHYASVVTGGPTIWIGVAASALGLLSFLVNALDLGTNWAIAALVSAYTSSVHWPIQSILAALAIDVPKWACDVLFIYLILGGTFARSLLTLGSDAYSRDLFSRARRFVIGVQNEPSLRRGRTPERLPSDWLYPLRLTGSIILQTVFVLSWPILITKVFAVPYAHYRFGPSWFHAYEFLGARKDGYMYDARVVFLLQLLLVVFTVVILLTANAGTVQPQ